MAANATGQSWGLRIRVDTKALNNLTDGATKIANLVAQLNELKNSAHAAMGSIATEVNKVNTDSAASVAQLRKDIQELKATLSHLKNQVGNTVGSGANGMGGGYGGGPGAGGYTIIPQRGRTGAATNKFLMHRYGVSEGFLEAHPQKAGGDKNVIGGGLPTPQRGPNGVRFYDNMQVMRTLLLAHAHQVVEGLKGAMGQAMGQARATTGTESQVDRAAMDALNLNMKTLDGSIIRLTEVILSAETLARRNASQSQSGNAPNGGTNAGGKKKTTGVKDVGDMADKGYTAADAPDAPQLKPNRGWDQLAARVPEFHQWASETASNEFDTIHATAYTASLKRLEEKRARRLAAAAKDENPDRATQAVHDWYTQRAEEHDRKQSAARGQYVQANTTNYTLGRVALEAELQGLNYPGRGSGPNGNRYGSGLVNVPVMRQMLGNIFGEEITDERKPGYQRRIPEAYKIVRGMVVSGGGAKPAAASSIATPQPHAAASAAPTLAGIDMEIVAQALQHLDEDTLEKLERQTGGGDAYYESVIKAYKESKAREQVARRRGERGSLMWADAPSGGGRRRRRSQSQNRNPGNTPTETVPPGEDDAPQTSYFGRRLKSVVSYMGAAGLVYGGISQVTQGVKTMMEFEHEMLNVQKVLQPVNGSIKELSGSAKEMGERFGTSLTDVAKSMAVFTAQGYKQKDIVEATRTAMMATVITDMNAAEATESLVTAQKSFKLSTSDSMKVLDTWNTIQNRTGVSARVMAGAMKQAGAVAKQSGMDFRTFSAMTAAVGETTRKSGEEIGGHLDYIIHGSRTDKAVEALQNVGIMSLDKNGNFKAFGDILTELRGKWKGMNDAQKEAIATSMGGTPRVNTFFTMVETWSKAQENANAALRENGSAAKSAEVMQQALANQVEQLKSAYDGLWVSLGESGGLAFLKNLAGALKGIVDLLGAVNKGTGGAMGGLLASAAVIAGPMMLMGGMGGFGGGAGRSGGGLNILNARNPNNAAGGVTVTGGMAAYGPMGGNGWMSNPQVRLGAGLIGLQMAKGGYDNYVRDHASHGVNTAVDTATGVGTTLLTGEMIMRGMGGKGIMGGMSGNKGLGKAAFLMIVATLASQIYGGVRQYVDQNKKTQEAAQQQNMPAQVEAEAQQAQASEGMALLSSKKIGEVISQYTMAVEKLIKKNDQILQSQQFVGDALARLKDIEGKGLEVTGGGMSRFTETLRGYDMIRDQGLGKFSNALDTRDKNSVALQYREFLGDVIGAMHSGKTMSLGTLMQGGFMSDRLGGMANQEAFKALNLLLERGGATEDRHAAEQGVTTNAAQMTLQGLMKNDGEYARVLELIGQASALRKQGKFSDASDLVGHAHRIVAGNVADSSEQLRKAYVEGSTKSLGEYMGTFQGGIGEMGSRYAYMLRSGQVSNYAQFRQTGEAQAGYGGLGRMASEAGKVAVDAQAEYQKLAATPVAERGKDFAEKLKTASDRVRMFTTAAATLQAGFDRLDSSVEHFEIGAERVADATELLISKAKEEAEARGLTGNNASRFVSSYMNREAAQVDGRTDLMPGEKGGVVRQLTQVARESKRTAQATTDSRELQKKMAQQAYLTYRLEMAAGLRPGNGAAGAADAMLKEWHEFVQNYAEANADKLRGADEGTLQKFFRDFEKSNGGYGAKMRELELSQNTEFQKNYMLASPSQRALVDQVRASIQQGMSADEIFGDPYLRGAAKDNPMLNELMGNAVNADFQRLTIQTQEESNRYLQQIADNTAKGMAGAGWNAPANSGLSTNAGPGAVDPQGRINADGTPAVLHKGEVVLNKNQADALLKNKYATGTLPKGGDLSDALGGGASRTLKRFFNSDNSRAARLHREFWNQTTNNWRRTVTDLSELSPKQQGDMLHLMTHRAVAGDRLGIGGDSMKALMQRLSVGIEKIADPSKQASFNTGKMRWRVGSNGEVERIFAAGQGRVTLGRIGHSSGWYGSKGLIERGSAVMSHEVGHALADVWKTSWHGMPAATANEHEYIRRLSAVVLDNSLPGMAQARGRVAHRYGLLDLTKPEAIYGRKYKDFLDETLQAFSEINRTGEGRRVLGAINRPMASAFNGITNAIRSPEGMTIADLMAHVTQGRSLSSEQLVALGYGRLVKEGKLTNDILIKGVKTARFFPARAGALDRIKSLGKGVGGFLSGASQWDVRFDNWVHSKIGGGQVVSDSTGAVGKTALAQRAKEARQVGELEQMISSVAGSDSAFAAMGKFYGTPLVSFGKSAWGITLGKGSALNDLARFIGGGIGSGAAGAWNRSTAFGGRMLRGGRDIWNGIPWNAIAGSESAFADMGRFAGSGIAGAGKFVWNGNFQPAPFGPPRPSDSLSRLLSEVQSEGFASKPRAYQRRVLHELRQLGAEELAAQSGGTGWRGLGGMLSDTRKKFFGEGSSFQAVNEELVSPMAKMTVGIGREYLADIQKARQVASAQTRTWGTAIRQAVAGQVADMTAPSAAMRRLDRMAAVGEYESAFGRLATRGGKLGRSAWGSTSGARSFLAEAAHPMLALGLGSAMLTGWDQRLADRMGIGEGYGQVRDVGMSGLGWMASNQMLKTGSFTGWGLRSELLGNMALRAESMSVLGEGSMMGRLGGAAGKGLRWADVGIGGAMKGLGFVGEVAAATELGYKGAKGIHAGLYYTGLESASTYHLMKQAHEDLGESFLPAYTQGLRGVFGYKAGADGSYDRRVWNQYWQNLSGDDAPAWYHPGDSLAATFGMATARQQVETADQEAEQNQSSGVQIALNKTLDRFRTDKSSGVREALKLLSGQLNLPMDERTLGLFEQAVGEPTAGMTLADVLRMGGANVSANAARDSINLGQVERLRAAYGKMLTPDMAQAVMKNKALYQQYNQDQQQGAFRDGGGVFRERADIQIAPNRNEMVVAPSRTSQLFEGLENLKKFDRPDLRRDFMALDARDFVSGQPAAQGSSSVSHAGEVTLRPGDGLEAIVGQLAALLSGNTKKAGVKVGDKVFSPLMG